MKNHLSDPPGAFQYRSSHISTVAVSARTLSKEVEYQAVDKPSQEQRRAFQYGSCPLLSGSGVSVREVGCEGGRVVRRSAIPYLHLHRGFDASRTTTSRNSHEASSNRLGEDDVDSPSVHGNIPRTTRLGTRETFVDSPEETCVTENLAAPSGTFELGGDLPVVRLGYGTMQLPGEGVWGPPKDHDAAIKVLRRAVEIGITFFDTADSYGPYVAEDLLREALHPYADDVVIATKAGLTRQGPGGWTPLGQPAYLRQEVEMSLRRLGLERIDLFQLHRIDPAYPVADQVGELKQLQDEGKIRHIGLSEVSVDDLKEAQKTAEIVSVQNLYNLAKRDAEELLDHCTAENIGFIPWFPLATGELSARTVRWPWPPRSTTRPRRSSPLRGC